jgi:hypothetical protein
MPTTAVMFAFGVAWFIVMPFVVLVHELGHAVPALFLSRRPVDVQVGAAGPALHVRYRSLRLKLHLGGSDDGAAGLARWQNAELSAVSRVFVSLGGPAGSAAGALATGALLARTSSLLHTVLLAATLFGWLMCVVNLLPFRTGKQRRPSDGLTALQMLGYILRHRTARLPTGRFDPTRYDPASDERTLATFRRMCIEREADSSAMDMDAAIAETLKHRPEFGAAVARRKAYARHLAAGRPDQINALSRACVNPEWRGA